MHFAYCSNDVTVILVVLIAPWIFEILVPWVREKLGNDFGHFVAALALKLPPDTSKLWLQNMKKDVKFMLYLKKWESL